MNRLIYATLKKSFSLQQLERLLPLTTHNAITPTILRSLTTTCSGSNAVLLQKSDGMPSAAVSQKKPRISPKITLVAQNQSMSVTSLDEAQKLAKRRDLRLIKVQELDTKTQRPVYRLATAAEMISDELEEFSPIGRNDVDKEKTTAHKKSEKSLSIGSRISDHDLASRLKNIAKWLGKRHEVRILVQGGANDMAGCEKIVQTIEQHVKEPVVLGKIVQKRTKGRVIKFNIVPVVVAASITETPPTTNTYSA